MNLKLRRILFIILAGIWINISEFFRNEVLLKKYWIAHYQTLGMTFPSEPLNGIFWMIWGFFFAIAIYILSRKFDFIQTALISWFVGFVLMWIVTWNLNVLPTDILIYAVPLSLLEVFLGSYICYKIYPKVQE